MEKKTLKLKFVGFWTKEVQNTRIYLDISKLYNIELSENPDYIICSCFAPYYEYCKYPQPRIMDIGENYIPDLNLVDYAICRYPISLLDRCFFYPGCIDFRGHFKKVSEPKEKKDISFVKSKKYFANFIASHDSENNIRGDFFKKLCEYKKVESAGSYLYNLENGENVNWRDSSKTDFQKKCKFTLCFESTLSEGFFTEKITDAFFAETIPVYFGSKEVFNVFNKDAVIYCESREKFDETIEGIIELDNDDEKYLEMINKPTLNENFSLEKFYSDYENFLKNIFNQDSQDAFRRSKVYLPKAHEEYLNTKNSPKKHFWNK